MNETLPDPPELDPAALAGTTFGRVRKGFEPAEVHAALGRAGDALRVWSLRDAQLVARIEELEARLADAQRVDESHLTTVLGEETARIVAAARDAAAEIRSKAEESAARLLRDTEEQARAAAEALRGEARALRDEAARVRDEAVAEATRVRAEAEAEAEAREQESTARSEQMLREAEQVLAERTASAEEAAASITEAARAELSAAEEAAERLRAEAGEESERLRVEAREESDRLRSESVAEAERCRSDAVAEAAALVEAARAEGRSMVAEAKAVRERILRDLVERRATARRQIEGARIGRDRIVEILRASIDGVRATIEEVEGADAAAAATAADAVADLAVDADGEVADLLVELGETEPVVLGTGEQRAEPDSGPSPADAGEEPVELEELRADDEHDHAAEAVADTAVEQAHPEDAAVEIEGEAATTVVEVVEVEAVETDIEEAEGTADAVAEPEVAPEAEIDDEVADADEGDEEDDDSPGATVHDLFARIRAEGLEGDDEDGGDDVELRDADDAEIDLTAVAADGTPEADERVAGGNGSVATVETTRALLDRRDELLGPIEKGFSRALRRLASDEQNEMLDQLRRVKRGRPSPESLLGDADAIEERYVDALLADFTRAADAGATFWSELAGTSAESLFGEDDALRERLAAGVRAFLDLHRAHLERTFADAESEALDVSDLSDRIRAAYRDWRSGSLSDVAGDLATAGFAHGERRAAGPGTPWRWVVDNGGLPCADGEDNALAGAVACDDPFPTGDLTPPAHPGCRCLLVPARQ